MPLQLTGFAGMAVGLALLAGANALPGGGDDHLVLVFGGFIMFNLLMNMGPNSTTFALPAEVFPSEIRATAHGLAAGFAKLGAALGLFFFPVFKDDLGITATLLIISALDGRGLPRHPGAAYRTEGPDTRAAGPRGR